MAKKKQTGIDLGNFSLTFIEENYISYDECLKALMIKRTALQNHIRDGKIFMEPGDTIILHNRKPVFLREAVKRELIKLFHDNGVR